MLRRGPEQLSHPRLAGLRAALGHGGRHVAAGRRGGLRARRTGASPRACWRSETTSGASRRWSSGSGGSTGSRTPSATRSTPSSTSTRRSRCCAHLLIGSEGTLAFLAEGVLRTVPDLPVKYTGLLFFRHIETAADAVVPLAAAGAAAIELMDRAALRSVETMPGVPAAARDARRRTRPGSWSNSSRRPDAARHAAARRPTRSSATLELVAPPEFTSDPRSRRDCGRCARGCSPPSAPCASAAPA